MVVVEQQVERPNIGAEYPEVTVDEVVMAEVPFFTTHARVGYLSAGQGSAHLIVSLCKSNDKISKPRCLSLIKKGYTITGSIIDIL